MRQSAEDAMAVVEQRRIDVLLVGDVATRNERYRAQRVRYVQQACRHAGLMPG
jgi:hypothetical protein